MLTNINKCQQMLADVSKYQQTSINISKHYEKLTEIWLVNIVS